jgi:hypothetical protein
MIARTLFVVLFLLALSHILAVGMDAETTRTRRAHKVAAHRVHRAAKHHATVQKGHKVMSHLKSKTYLKVMSFLKHHTSVSALTSQHLLAMDHAMTLLHHTLKHMKSAMKNLRSHAIARSRNGDKDGYVYADVVDSLDNYVLQPSCAALPYYVSTCTNCVNYVHQCLNCVYDTPKVVPTIVPRYLLSTSYLPSLPSFPYYYTDSTSYPQISQTTSQQPDYTGQYDYNVDTTESPLHSVNHVQTLLDNLKTGLPTLEQGLFTISTDIHKIQAHLPGGVTDSDAWPTTGDQVLSDVGTLNNIAQHTDVGGSGPHLNHILTVVNSIQHSIPDFQRDLQQMQSDMARIQRYHETSLMSEPTTSDSTDS